MELAGTTGFSASSNRHYRQAIRDFAAHVDASVPAAGAALLARRKSDVHHAVADRVRLLPARFVTGSRMPYWLAGRVRTLVGRRIAHPGRAVDVRLADWVDGMLGLRRGQIRSWSEPSKHSGSRCGNCRRSPAGRRARAVLARDPQ
ncbi:hypothetical protein DMH15_34935 [Streptomyces sp. WAC 06725]|uniref:hypothetical protein n=1 Tax=Streptomyces sp. WAC 06725 TaxID=2203209 RepID=UPI000F746D08|nr:hypothetical protein [Streptomyces sp. WAC 06725]RSO21614.1 hypothetical protein DMH15_34935 [Streptomyces sp. WAC 06725]